MRAHIAVVLVCTLAHAGSVKAQSSQSNIQILPYSTPAPHWQRQRQIALSLIAGALSARTQGRALSTENIEQLTRDLDDRILYVSLQWLAAVANTQLLRFPPIRQQVGAVIKHSLQVVKPVQKPDRMQHMALNDIIASDKYYQADSSVILYLELINPLAEDARKIIDNTIALLAQQPA
jgi:hypothetical protein